MPSAATIGYNTILKKGDGGSPETFTDYGLEITSLDGIGITREMIDATHMQSPSQFREMIGGMLTAGALTVEVNFVPTKAAAMAALVTGPAGNWQVLLGAYTYTVTGQGSGFTVGAITPDGKLTASFVLTITSGAPVWA